MSEKKRIILSPFGLRETDLRLLKTISAVSDGLGRPYGFVCSTEPVALPTIWVVDEEALADWREQHEYDGAVSVVIASNGESAGDERVVRRPVTASRLLALLDAVVEKELAASPALVICEASAAPQTDLPSGGNGGFFRRTALVVDDSRTIQKQIELGLRLNGVAAVCVDSGEAALAALERQDFDLVFLDVVLSGDADGYQVCRAIKRNAANKHMPVIMLTSRSSTFDRVRGSMVGCDTYLTKPVDAETFNAILAKYLPKAEEGSFSTEYTPASRWSQVGG